MKNESAKFEVTKSEINQRIDNFETKLVELTFEHRRNSKITLKKNS